MGRILNRNRGFFAEWRRKTTSGGVITDATLLISDITTNDVSITKHGFAPKAPNDTAKYLRGDATWAAVSGGHIVKDEGTPLTQRAGLNFVGTLVTVTDDAGNDETDVTIAIPTLEQARTANSTLAGTVNFAGYKAIAQACDNGATLPSTPTTGQWFLHTPTGRTTLMQYLGSTWYPMASFGNVTTYVDSTDGTDSADKGGSADAGAFKTIMYAWNQLAKDNIGAGTAIIYVNGETYYEQVKPINKFGYTTITIQGTMTNQATKSDADIFSATTIGKTGSGWTVNAYTDMIVRITGGTGSGQRRVIMSNTATTVTIHGGWRITPDATSDFVIESWLTIISGATAGSPTTPARDSCIEVYQGQSGIILDQLQLQYNNTTNLLYEGGLVVRDGASVEINSIRITKAHKSLHILRDALLASESGGLMFDTPNSTSTMLTFGPAVYVSLHAPYVYNGTALSVRGVTVLSSIFRVWYGGTFDGNHSGGLPGYGIVPNRNSMFEFLYSTTANTIVRNWLGGIVGYENGIVVGAIGTVTYSGNTRDIWWDFGFSAAGAIRSYHTVEGSAVLVAGTVTVTLTPPASFSSATNYTVLLQNANTGKTYKVVNSSGTAFVITSSSGTDTDTMRYVAIGD